MNFDTSTVLDTSTFVNMCAMIGHMATAPLAVLADDATACCSPLTEGELTDDAAERLAATFKALADPTRVKLLSLIAGSAGGEACVCDLTAPVALSQPTVSHHMKLLVDAGLVSREQRGKWVYYRVERDTLDQVARAVTAITT